MSGANQLYYDDIFDNNTLVVEILAQLSLTAMLGSQHSVLVDVDYGMDGVDYANITSVEAGAPQPATFNAVSRMRMIFFRHVPVKLSNLRSG